MKKLVVVITALMLALSAFPAFAAEADDTDGGDMFTVSYISTADEASVDEIKHLTGAEPEVTTEPEATSEPEATAEPSEDDYWWDYESTPDETPPDACPGDDPPAPGGMPDDPGCPGDDDPWWEPATEPYEETQAHTCAPITEVPEATESDVTVAPTYVPTYAPTAAPIPKTDPPEQPMTQAYTVAPCNPTNVLPPINKDTSVPRFDLITGTMRAGKTLLLTVRNSGGNKIKFSSSNTKVAKISSKGLVTTLKKGFVKITAKVGSKYCYFTLKVISNPTLSKKSIKVKKGKTKKVLIYDKAPSVKLKFKNKKKAKIVSKTNVNYIKVLGRKRGKTTLQVRVNGKWLKLGVKVI